MNDQLTGGLTGQRVASYGAAIVLGLVASSVHWLGILLGGVLIGLLSPNTRRGILYGAAWGLLVWLVFAVWTGMSGILPTGGSAQLWAVSFGSAVVLGGVGGTVAEFRSALVGLSPS